MAKTKKRRFSVIQIILILIIVVCLGILGYFAAGYIGSRMMYNDLSDKYTVTDTQGTFTVDWDALEEQYPDVVGWIRMDDVDISYPIVQGPDNSTYLYAAPDKSYMANGSIFLDYRGKSLATDSCSLIYGHNMNDRSMFGNLMSYQDQAFYQSGKDTFTIYTRNATLEYKIFDASIVAADNEIYTDCYSGTTTDVLKELKSTSLYETGMTVSSNDQIVLLSTCSDDNHRLLVAAKKVS